MTWFEWVKQLLRRILPVWKRVDEVSDAAYEKIEEVVKD